MKPKMMAKISIDLVMTLLLLFLMARQVTGGSAHEWIGLVLFLFWIIHHVLNFRWHGHLFRGKYTPFRMLQLIVNLLLLLSMLGTMVSAVILSREVFAFLPITGGVALARTLHILCVFWGFVLMALHLGLHWNMLLGMIRKMTGTVSRKSARITLRIVSIGIAGYGLYGFLHNQFLDYMFLTSSFVFFDFKRPVILFFTEYVAIMGLFVFIAYYVGKGLQRLAGTKKGAQGMNHR